VELKAIVYIGLISSLGVYSYGQNIVARDPAISDEFREKLQSTPFIDIGSISANGAPSSLIISNPSLRLVTLNRFATEHEIRTASRSVLEAMGFSDSDLVFLSSKIDSSGYLHAIFKQVLNGVPYVGGEIRIHFSNKGTLTSIGGFAKKASYTQLAKFPVVASSTATSVLLSRTNARDKKAETPRLVYVHIPSIGEPRLAWETRITGATFFGPINDLVYVDAINGEEVQRIPQLHSAKAREIYDGANTFSHGTLARNEGGSPYGYAEVNTNYTYLGDTYDYYSAQHGRDSWDNSGGTIKGTIRFQPGLKNAYWIGGSDNRMIFGEGDGTSFGPFTNSRELVAHEFTHGVT